MLITDKTAAFGMQFFFGAFLSDLSHYEPHITWLKGRRWPSQILSPILIIIGFLLASYPENMPEWRPWSRQMLQISVWIFPKYSDTPRFYTGLGLEFIILGVHFSHPIQQKILSNNYLLWFGRNSFAIYLIHSPLFRTLLVWMLFGIKTPSDDFILKNGILIGPTLKMCGRFRWYFCLPIWFAILCKCANLWTKHINPFCTRLTQKLEEFVFKEDEESSCETRINSVL